jgi:hypothetical protein
MRVGCIVGLLVMTALRPSVASANAPLVPSPEEYARLCTRVNAITGRSIQDIRQNLPELAGHHVEICGKVLGNAHPVHAETDAINVLLQSTDDSCFVTCPPNIPELQPGRCVRLLLSTPKDAADISDCKLEAVLEDPRIAVRQRRLPPTGGTADTEQRVEIGEAAMGVRDRPPQASTAPSQPPALTPKPGVGGPAVPAVPSVPGSPLPPQLCNLPTLSSGPAASTGTMGTAPRISLVAQTQGKYTYEQGVKVWTDWVRGINPSLAPEIADAIVRWTVYYAAVNGVDHRLMFAVMRYESSFDPRCVSHAGAMGLTQLMPFNVETLKVRDPFDIAENIRGGTEHLAEFLRRYADKGNYERTVLALACYNAGPNAVKKYGGVPPYRETQDYVRKVPKLFADLVKQGYP